MDFPERFDRRKHILSKVKKPCRYIGGEWGIDLSVDWEDPKKVKLCLAFPDTYEVGMSYLGFQILFDQARRIPHVSVDRCYCPWLDMEQELRRANLPLTGINSEKPLCEFDVVGFTLQYELTYTNILTMLELGGIPLKSCDRSNSDPLVIAGGPGALCPEPLGDFFDVFCLGDGEILLPELLDVVKETKNDRLAAMEELRKRQGFYVPLLEEAPFEEGITYKRRVVPNLDEAFTPTSMLVPLSGIVHDRAAVEVFRGCTRGCRFCQAGMIYRPLRERSPKNVVEIAKKILKATGWEELGLVSLASCDYSGLNEVIDAISPFLEEKNVTLSLPSLRMDAFSIELAQNLKAVSRSGLTFAPEAGTQRLRDVINKGVTEEDIKKTFEEVARRGWEGVKLYFMMGLPTEKEEDLEGIIEVAKEAMNRGKGFKKRLKVNVSVAGFVPKPHTPFQWEPQASMEYLNQAGRWLKGQAKKAGFKLSYHDPEQTFLEGVIARGDRSVGVAIEEAWKMGARFDGWSECFDLGTWMKAFEAVGVDPYQYANRARDMEEVLPWDHIDVGISKDFLRRERAKALAGKLTVDCRGGKCNACGWETRGCPVVERVSDRS
ncbi:MAG: hypothetical protein PWP05_288 [Thermovirga sp.]|nr:hypothetical protein [Thermovirga sp.]